VSGPIAAMRRTRTRPWTVWKFNWLADHKIVAALKRARPHARGVLLDIGCGRRPFAWVFDGRVSCNIGVDLRSSPFLGSRPPDIYGRAEALPIRDESVDTVFGISMLTYLQEPVQVVEEAYRVLKPGGTLLLEFTQMAPVHDPPHDYFRFTRYGAAHLLERAGFQPIEFIPIGGLMSRVGLSAIAALNRINRGPTRVITEVPVRALYVVLQLLFAGLDLVCFDPREVLANRVVARKQAQAPEGHRGRG
jgi:SAM-dependent methyltransferase